MRIAYIIWGIIVIVGLMISLPSMVLSCVFGDDGCQRLHKFFVRCVDVGACIVGIAMFLLGLLGICDLVLLCIGG